LVYDDGDKASTKYNKALALGIQMMSRSQFAKRYKI